MMKIGKNLLAVGLASLLIFGATGCAKAAEVPVVAKAVKKTTVEAFGKIKGRDVENIIIDFPAQVKSIPVKEGQKIKKGDTLVELDLRSYNTSLAAKKGMLITVRLEAKKLRDKLANVNTGEKADPDITKLMNDITYTEKMYNEAIKEQKSMTEMQTMGDMSGHELEIFNRTVDEKKKAWVDAKSALNTSLKTKKIGNGDLQSDISIQEQKAADLEREIGDLEKKLSMSYIKNSKVISNVDNGVVYEIGYVKGDLLDTSKKLLSIMSLNTITIEANVAEEFIKDVKIGASVECNPLADKSKSYKGTVKSISGKAILDNGETVVPVEITIDNNDGFLLPGFNVDVSINMR